VPFLPSTSVLAVSWAHPGSPEQRATSQTPPVNSQGGPMSDCACAASCSARRQHPAEAQDAAAAAAAGAGVEVEGAGGVECAVMR
jgi:hypothetical protein